MRHAVEHRGLDHRVVNHVFEDNPLAHLQFVVEGPVAVVVARQAAVAAHAPARFALGGLVGAEDGRLVGHFKAVGHVAGERHVEHGRAHAAVFDDVLDGRDQIARAPRKGAARLENQPQVGIAGVEVAQDGNQLVAVVFGVRHQMAAAHVEPLELRQQLAEVPLERLERQTQMLGPRFAEDVEMEPLDAGRQLAQLLGHDAQPRPGHAGVVECRLDGRVARVDAQSARDAADERLLSEALVLRHGVEGDVVAVEASPGHDIGTVTLTGRLVPLQMRKSGMKPDTEIKRIYRKVKPIDMEKYEEAKSREHATMIKSRKIAEDLGLQMKIGDVEYQGDGNKAIFYYIADERVDFRQLIKVLAEAFRVRIEMKQIGARQEAGRIGGIGPCGRELCCATWMTSFVSVSTSAARFQDISLNPQKLAGQCAKLKCCLNYEVDAYVECQKRLPSKEIVLETQDATYYYFRADILGGTITYSTDKSFLANEITIPARRAFEVLNMNKRGEKPLKLNEDTTAREPDKPKDLLEQESVTRFDKSKNAKNKKKKNKSETRNENNGPKNNGRQNPNKPSGNGEQPAENKRPVTLQEPMAAAAKNNDTTVTAENTVPKENRNRGDRQPRENRPPRDKNRQPKPNKNKEQGTSETPEMKAPENKPNENRRQEERNNQPKRRERTEAPEGPTARENGQPGEQNNNRNRNNRRPNGNNRRPNDGNAPEGGNTEPRKQEGEIHA